MVSGRQFSLFEKMLLVSGIIIIALGYLFIQRIVAYYGITAASLQAVFLWLILVVLIIIAGVAENMKEELKTIALNQSKETRMLREDLRRNR